MRTIACLLFTVCWFMSSGANAATYTAGEAQAHIGDHGTVCGLVASAKYATSTNRQPTFLSLDRAYPNQVFTALIWGKDRDAFPYAPESLQGSSICVKGTITSYKGRAEIIVSNPDQITKN